MKFGVCFGAIVFVAPLTAAAQSAPSAFTSAARYDVEGRVTGQIAPDPNDAASPHFAALRNTYDILGNVTRSERGELSAWQSESITPLAWAGFTVFNQIDTVYDIAGRKLRETVSANGTTYQVTQFSYDPAGRLLCTAVRMDPTQWDGQGDACAPQTTGSNGPDRITKNVYDPAGQLAQVRVAVGTSLEQAHSTYSYTPNGRQEYVIDANGNRAKMEYDAFDRQVKWIFPAVARPSAFNPSTQESALATAGDLDTNDYEQYGYDPNGNRTSLRKRDNQFIGYAYDGLNRMTLKDLPSGADVYYGYDLQGRKTYARFGSTNGAGLTNGYDDFGRLITSSTNLDGVTRTLGYQYDANGNRKQLTFPDGQYFTYDYDRVDRMTTVRENGGAAISSLYYDPQGRRLSLTGGVSTSYGYDNVDRLTSIAHDLAGDARDVTFSLPAYNPANQALARVTSNSSYTWNSAVDINRGYATNGLNQYTVVGPESLGYDPNGNLISSGRVGYVYDVENRLVSASGALTASLAYDPMGRLWQTSGGSAGVTRFLYDGDDLVAEYDGSGALLRRYIHGPNADDPLVWYEGASLSNRRVIRTDHQGSVVAIADAEGASVAVANYDEYGIPGTGNIGRFAYTGQAWIPELQMYHYKSRIYSPTLGRFLQTDPIGYGDDLNLYAYVGGDPINKADPTGKAARVVGGRIEINPDVPGVPSVTIPMVIDGLPGMAGNRGFAENCFSCHHYDTVDSAPSNLSLQALSRAIATEPTPNGSNGASPNGTLNDVGALGPISSNLVYSFSIKSPDPGRFTDIAVNYTVPGHAAAEGFVMQYGERMRDGSITLHSYGEGNSFPQSGIESWPAWTKMSVWTGAEKKERAIWNRIHSNWSKAASPR